MESVIEEHEVMVITKARQARRATRFLRRGLRELGAQEKALATPDPGTKATPVRITEPEGALALMMPEHNPLLSSSHAARFVTAAG